MDRRSFIQGLIVGSASVLAPQRVYSFLQNNPLACDPYEYRIARYGSIFVSEPQALLIDVDPFAAFYLAQKQIIEVCRTLIPPTPIKWADRGSP